MHYSKENEHELEGGKDLMTVSDMIKAGFSTLLGEHVMMGNSRMSMSSTSDFTKSFESFDQNPKEEGGKHHSSGQRGSRPRCPRRP